MYEIDYNPNKKIAQYHHAYGVEEGNTGESCPARCSLSSMQ